jgi:hypothetical protein
MAETFKIVYIMIIYLFIFVIVADGRGIILFLFIKFSSFYQLTAVNFLILTFIFSLFDITTGPPCISHIDCPDSMCKPPQVVACKKLRCRCV